ncbi:Microtubule-associated protein 70-2 [Thalictrum thalictroides]|uniref:Microtubule-associated protein 70-2 n=1 Tax=Thalictrum thalictroides TaxID=46969 RepID=A0A7J6W817_THATH|nr:Microtubule-associated protein 70-2 [Thalictrum thalictroides]
MMRTKKALDAQFAAEATLRIVHAAQKDDEMPPIEANIAPLEAELKMAGLEDKKKTLDQELAHARVSANRVAVVVANEWKDGNDKVMPVKQWLEERRFLQVFMDFC